MKEFSLDFSEYPSEGALVLANGSQEKGREKGRGKRPE